MASGNGRMGQAPARFGLQFKVLATLAVLFIVVSLATIAWVASIIQSRSLQDAQARAVALSDQMDAVWDYVDENQPATNVYVRELGDQARGLVCVSAVKSIARDFSRENDSEIHVVALNPRNREDEPDDFERQALEAFAHDEELGEYAGVATSEDGGEVYYYLRPRRITESCLTCHGDPAGEIDPLGYPKEGYRAGMVAGAVSVRESMEDYAANVSGSAWEGMTFSLLGLLAVMGVMYFVLRRFVILPVARVSVVASAYRPGAGSQRINEPRGSDEIAELARDFNTMADDLDGLYANLEDRVEERTAELERLNGELQVKQEELAQAFSKLQDETEYKDRLFASLSHDLRTPLASIIAYTQLAEAQMDTVPGQTSGEADADVESRNRETLESIGEQARTLVGMVDNILAFSRADANGITVHPMAVDLLDVAAHLRLRMQPIAQRSELDFEVLADAGLPLIEADRDLLVRVLDNLAANAVKFTPAGGSVRVSIAAEAEEPEAADVSAQSGGSPEAAVAALPKSQVFIRMVVEDTGVGIAEDDLQRIFEPYTKGAYREGGARYGAGLGLAVISQIADAMQGDVWAEQREGGGSRFTFRFPAIVLDEEDYE